MSNNTYMLSYTGFEIDEKLGKIDRKADKAEVPSKISELENDSNFMASNEVLNEDGIIKQDILPEGYPYTSILDFATTLQADPENGESLITDKFELVSGNSYKVTWNGTEYTCTAQPLDFGGLIAPALGNLSVADENYENTNEPFIIGALPKEAAQEFGAYGTVLHLDGSTEANLSIYGNVTRKIDEKYLPDSDLKNIVDGSAVGSVRGIFTAEETNGYTMGDYSHAEGVFTKASGNYSHAEGHLAEASGLAAHAEGSSKASGDHSHAEGNATEASSYVSHAEGNGTKASGQNSHAEGVSTIAMYNQHVQGRYNIVDGTDYTSKYAHIVGNGTGVNERSNAHTLDWDGNAWYAGDVVAGDVSLKELAKSSVKSDLEQPRWGIKEVSEENQSRTNYDEGGVNGGNYGPGVAVTPKEYAEIKYAAKIGRFSAQIMDPAEDVYDIDFETLRYLDGVLFATGESPHWNFTISWPKEIKVETISPLYYEYVYQQPKIQFINLTLAPGDEPDLLTVTQNNTFEFDINYTTFMIISHTDHPGAYDIVPAKFTYNEASQLLLNNLKEPYFIKCHIEYTESDYWHAYLTT